MSSTHYGIPVSHSSFGKEFAFLETIVLEHHHRIKDIPFVTNLLKELKRICGYVRMPHINWHISI
jgi:hypothetical protein